VVKWIAALAVLSLAVGGGVGGAQEARFVGAPLAGFRSPFDFVPIPGGSGAMVLEDLSRRVVAARERGQSETLPGLQGPRALGVDEDGLVLVLDSGAPWVLVAFRDGRELWRRGLKGDLAPADPVALAVRDGVAWVVDRSPPRAFLFAYDGTSLGSVDLQGHARSPFSLALGATGEAFIADPMGPAVLSLSPTGALLGRLSLEGSGVTRPTGVAVGPSGRVWVSDGVTGSVLCLDPVGAAGAVRCGGETLRFDDPLRLAWAGGQLWVLEARPGRVRRVSMEGP